MDEVIIRKPGKLSEISPFLFGHFIEHLGRCIYHGIMRKKSAAGSDWEIDERVFELVEELKPPILRWPGGLFADTYHWADGIGRIDKRPLRKNEYWKKFGKRFGPPEPNAFGTHEFLDYCDGIQAEPYININMGTGTPAEAAKWVEYTNSKSSPSWLAGQRADNGREKPYGVKIWGIGNEMYGAWAKGHMRAEQYGREYLIYEQAMRKVDPSIKLVAVGAFDDFPRWSKNVLEIVGDRMDYLAVHIYIPNDPVRLFTVGLADNLKNYYSVVASPTTVENKLHWAWSRVTRVLGEDTHVRLALDEWNLMPHFLTHFVPSWRLRDALFAGGIFNALIRCADFVGMANYAQMVNVLGLIGVKRDKVFTTPVYWVFKLYSTLAGSKMLDIEVKGETFENKKLGNVPKFRDNTFLDASATIDEKTGIVTLFVVNRHRASSIKASISVEGLDVARKFEVHEVNGPHIHARNSASKEEIHGIRVSSGVFGIKPSYTFPAHSVTALVMKKVRIKAKKSRR